MKQIEQTLTTALIEALEALNIPFDSQIRFAVPSDPTHGDISCNLAMQVFPSLPAATFSSPHAFALEIVSKMQANVPSQIQSVSVAGPGFINFVLRDALIQENVHTLSKEISFPPLFEEKKVVVEFSSPNIAKPFTVGHLRSTIIGNAVANLYATLGWTVYKDNHVGDWGTQFGKLIVAITKWGNLDTIEAEERPVKQLVELYVKFHAEAKIDPTLEDQAREWFTKLEHGDATAREIWQRCIDLSLKEFHQIYGQLGITFTENEGKGYGESFFEDKMADVVAILEKSGFLQVGEQGAKLFFFPNDEYPPLMILKKDGSTLYSTRDLATDFFRLNHYGKEIRIINEVGAEQSLYFSQLFRIEELLGWYPKGQRIHVKHGLFRLKDQKMSTRSGNVIWLEDVLTEALTRAKKLAVESEFHSDDAARTRPIVGDSQTATSISQSKQTTTQIATGAIKWNDLKRSPQMEVVFDWDELLSMHGNSGPYMQYTVVRAKSVLSKAGELPEGDKANWTMNPLERHLAYQLTRFVTVVEQAAYEHAPHILTTYLYSLAQLYNSFYNTYKILGSGEEESKRITLTQATAGVIEKGCAILGIQIPTAM